MRRSIRKGVVPSTSMFMRPSSKRSSTLLIRAEQPISLSPSSDSQTIPNSLSSLDALADHQLVALLEDVQRHQLVRDQHEPEREQREALDGLRHRDASATCRSVSVRHLVHARPAGPRPPGPAGGARRAAAGRAGLLPRRPPARAAATRPARAPNSCSSASPTCASAATRQRLVIRHGPPERELPRSPASSARAPSSTSAPTRALRPAPDRPRCRGARSRGGGAARPPGLHAVDDLAAIATQAGQAVHRFCPFHRTWLACRAAR